MRRTEFIMGMPIILDIPNASDYEPFKLVFGRLKAIDRRFSPYLVDSEVSRYRRGELKPGQLSTNLKRVMTACRRAEADTDGYFSAWAGGEFDPSGYVKGWAIKQAAGELRRRRVRTFCLSAGGDILAVSDGSKTWRIGIQDPSNKHGLISVLEARNRAVATSGNYERGEHILNPKTHKPVNYWASFSVAGPDIVMADVLATAGFAAGSRGMDFIGSRRGYEALGLHPNGKLEATKRFSALT